MKMKKKLLQIIADTYDICLTEIPKMIPESKGEYSAYLPVKNGYNPNILMVGNVSQDFIKLFNELEQSKQIIKEPCTVMIHLIDGAPVYSLPIVTNTKGMKGKKEHWIPLVIKKGENFPKDIQKKSLMEQEEN